MTPGRVDAHVHLSRWWKDLPGTAYRSDLEFTVPSLLREMDAQGVEFAVLLQLETSPTVEETLAEGQDIFTKSGGRLLRTSTVDPTRGKAEVAHAIELWAKTSDLVALKLYPGYRHFYPHDARLAPVYEFAHRKGIPVMIHQGDTLDRDGFVKYARPVEMDEVAVRYRDVSFVLCHLGNPWIDEAAEVVYKNPNVYTDTSGLLARPIVPRFREMVALCRARLQQAINMVGDPSRFLYGSDWPLESIQEAVGVVEGLELSREEKDAILGGNARNLYRL